MLKTEKQNGTAEIKNGFKEANGKKKENETNGDVGEITRYTSVQSSKL
jgi:hypothetical protein